MTARVDQIPATQVTTLITGLRNDLDTLKSAQRVGGTNLLVYTQTTPSTTPNADYGYQSFTLASGAQTPLQTVKFNSATQSYAFVDLTYRLFVDSPTNEVPLTTTTPYPLFNFQPTFGSGALVNTWEFALYNSDTVSHSYYIRFYVQSTDTGTF